MTPDRPPFHGGQIFLIVAAYRRPALFGLALAALASLLALSVPLLIKGFIDRVAIAGHWADLPVFVLAMTAIIIAQARVAYDLGRVIGRVGNGVVRDLRHAVYDHIQRLSLTYFDRTSAGSMVSRLMDDVDALQGLITNQAVTILTDLGTSLVVMAFLIMRNERVAAVVLGMVPIYLVNLRYFGDRIRNNSTLVRTKMDALLGGLKEKLDAIALIKTAGREQAETDDFAILLRDVHAPRVVDARLRATFSAPARSSAVLCRSSLSPWPPTMRCTAE